MRGKKTAIMLMFDIWSSFLSLIIVLLYSEAACDHNLIQNVCFNIRDGILVSEGNLALDRETCPM